ncbi:unnamed protein product [Rangifer tarandus platyrhynchus]|uniref:Uncharacterized protein n=2 Tax=Rangifer tarandus platyrhynchus TaxID=3082113 RepID=A0ABN8YC58_RANTA|nr:unnamed protein product [Rangifer tarandus platyrhynchus]
MRPICLEPVLCNRRSRHDEKPICLEPVLCNKRSHHGEKPMRCSKEWPLLTRTKAPTQQRRPSTDSDKECFKRVSKRYSDGAPDSQEAAVHRGPHAMNPTHLHGSCQSHPPAESCPGLGSLWVPCGSTRDSEVVLKDFLGSLPQLLGKLLPPFLLLHNSEMSSFCDLCLQEPLEVRAEEDRLPAQHTCWLSSLETGNL